MADDHFGVGLDRQPPLPALPPIPTLDEVQPSREMRGGYDFCTLCNVLATESHLVSESHRRRLEWSKQAPSALAVAETAIQPLMPRPDWMEVNDEFELCTLCGKHATDGHLASEKHRQRVEWHEWSRENGLQPATSDGTPARWGDPSNFEWRVWGCNSPGEGMPWWWCRLCDQWADDQHVQSRRHTQRVEWGADWYLNDAALPALTDRGAVDDADAWRQGIRQPVQEPSRSPWQQAWSEEHQQHYYWHEQTRETQWDPPLEFYEPVMARATPAKPPMREPLPWVARAQTCRPPVVPVVPVADSLVRDVKWC